MRDRNTPNSNPTLHPHAGAGLSFGKLADVAYGFIAVLWEYLLLALQDTGYKYFFKKQK